MSTTTTLKLPDDLKARIATAAEQASKTPHAFMVEALQLQTEVAERREFVQEALLAREEVAQYGLVYDADEVFSYLLARLDGKPAKQPDPTKLLAPMARLVFSLEP
jgi:predicted transcriptional regulator